MDTDDLRSIFFIGCAGILALSFILTAIFIISKFFHVV